MPERPRSCGAVFCAFAPACSREDPAATALVTAAEVKPGRLARGFSRWPDLRGQGAKAVLWTICAMGLMPQRFAKTRPCAEATWMRAVPRAAAICAAAIPCGGCIHDEVLACDFAECLLAETFFVSGCCPFCAACRSCPMFAPPEGGVLGMNCAPKLGCLKSYSLARTRRPRGWLC